MDIKATAIFERNYEAISGDKRFIINEGGSRSSKTYSLCQLMIIYCLQNNNKVVSVIRKTFPALRATVLRDFIEILRDIGLYNEENHNKSEQIYTFANGSMVEFFSVDNEQKINSHSSTSNISLINVSLKYYELYLICYLITIDFY